MADYLDPIYLPIVPPMDLNHNMPGIDAISPFPMELRSNRGVGLFGTRRGAGNNGLITFHEAADLLAPIGTPVFAAATGKVIGGSATSALIFHDLGFRFLTFYQHMQKKSVKTGDQVTSGQQIAEVGDWTGGTEDHLHFEIRYLFDTVAKPTRENTLPIDPTNVLYQWESKTYQNDPAVRQGHIFDNVSITNIEEVWRDRLLRFVMINVSGSKRDLYIPLIDTSEANLSLVTTLKSAFFYSKKVRIVWRESLFFKNIQTADNRASIIAEVKVLS